MERGRLILIIVAVTVLTAAIIVAIAVPVSVNNKSKRSIDLAKEYMSEVPLIDTHNDLVYHFKVDVNNRLEEVDLTQRVSWNVSHTDIPRLREGMVSGQFWSAWSPCESQYLDALRHILDQIDVIKRMVEKYPTVFDFVTTAQGIEDSFGNKKIASLIGIEGGHSIDSSMATLRMLYELGVRYITLTHNCNTPWADSWLMSAEAYPEHNGLTDWGKDVVREMNRLGMLVDLSHVSFKTMSDALEVTSAPIIFSHSSAYEVCHYDRNVPDDILRKVKANGGVVMVDFYHMLVNCFPGNISKENGVYATLSQVADHLDHVKEVCGSECVGFGSDFNGMDHGPQGLEDVSKFPDLVAELIERGWSETEVKGAIGNNLLRVFRKVEEVSATMKATTIPNENTIPRDSEINNTCRTYVYNP